MKITFWKDNRLDQEHEVEIKQIVKDFYESNSRELDSYKNGIGMENAYLIFCSRVYGAFEKLSVDVWDELYKQNMEYRDSIGFKFADEEYNDDKRG